MCVFKAIPLAILGMVGDQPRTATHRGSQNDDDDDDQSGVQHKDPPHFANQMVCHKVQ